MTVEPNHTQHLPADPDHLEQISVAPQPSERRRPSRLAIVAGTAALGTVSSVAVAGVAFADRGRDWGYRGDRHWLGFGGILLLLAVIAATAAVTALIVSRRSAVALPGGGAAPAPVGDPMSSMPPAPPAQPAPPVSPTAAAEAILAERLARGEISPDDYRSGIAALRGDTSNGA